MIETTISTGVTATASVVVLDKTSDTPMYQQIRDSLRDAIAGGRLIPGTRLPSTREFADDLAVSRNTISAAYDELWAEGYLNRRRGAGTFVSDQLPEGFIRAASTLQSPPSAPATRTPVSGRGSAMVETPVTRVNQSGEPRPFRPGVPALDRFPMEDWRRASARAWNYTPPNELLGYGDPGGHLSLREAVADYLGATRAVRCEPEQVIIVSGSQQGLHLVSQVLTDPGDKVWMEDPGRTGAHGAFRTAGCRLIPIPVDDDGLVVSEGISQAEDARISYVSPSYQFPLAVTMSLPRRQELLEWADKNDTWIIEDDYDSEYRFVERPLPALQGMADPTRVIYVGTFSRMLFPSLRVGYIVAPPFLVDAILSAKVLSDRHTSTWQQIALAEFIRAGDLQRHVRRMRLLYANRRRLVVKLLKESLAGVLEVVPNEAGMHVLAKVQPSFVDVDIEESAASSGVEVAALSRYSISRDSRRNGLLLGHAVAKEEQIPDAIERLEHSIHMLAALATSRK